MRNRELAKRIRVFIVMHEYYDDTYPVEAFSTRENAQTFIDGLSRRQRRHKEIVELEVDKEKAHHQSNKR